MESTKAVENKAVTETEKLIGGGKFDGKPETLIKFSRIITTMPQRQNREAISSVVCKLF